MRMPYPVRSLPSPLLAASAAAEDGAAPGSQEELAVGGVIERSAESARLIVFTSNDFLTDQVLGTMGSMGGGQYLAPLELIANALDWSLEDSGLLGIRSNAHFNRTLPPLERESQMFWEYSNYALAIILLLMLALWQRHRRKRRHQSYLKTLGAVT